MKRICKYCGKEYDGSPWSSACPDCVAENKKNTIRTRVCRQCGRDFPGGPRAWYCQDCRAVRKREQDARCKKHGAIRPIGSIDQCVVCGADYVVSSGQQKYCAHCAPEKVREADRKQGIQWYRENVTPSERKKQQQASGAPIKCAACGKPFVPRDASKTCSPECRNAYQKRYRAEWEAKNRENRNEYQRNRLRNKIAAMSPEERQEYYAKIQERRKARKAAAAPIEEEKKS